MFYKITLWRKLVSVLEKDPHIKSRDLAVIIETDLIKAQKLKLEYIKLKATGKI